MIVKGKKNPHKQGRTSDVQLNFSLPCDQFQNLSLHPNQAPSG